MPTTNERKCKIEGCKGEYRAKGYCTRHYRKWRQGEYGSARYKICTEENCPKPRFKGSLCETHYNALAEAKGKKTKAVPAEGAPQEGAPPEGTSGPQTVPPAQK